MISDPQAQGRALVCELSEGQAVWGAGARPPRRPAHRAWGCTFLPALRRQWKLRSPGRDGPPWLEQPCAMPLPCCQAWPVTPQPCIRGHSRGSEGLSQTDYSPGRAGPLENGVLGGGVHCVDFLRLGPGSFLGSWIKTPTSQPLSFLICAVGAVEGVEACRSHSVWTPGIH